MHCLKPNETSFEWQSAGQGQSSLVREFDSVRLKKCSILFDWQNVWASSIMFDYRTQSKSIERLSSITERSFGYAGANQANTLDSVSDSL